MLSTRQRILQNFEGGLNIVRDKKRGYCSPSILPAVSEKATISASSIISFSKEKFPFLAVEGTTEPVRFEGSKIILALFSPNGYRCMINSRVDGVSVIRCPPLALDKHL